MSAGDFTHRPATADDAAAAAELHNLSALPDTLDRLMPADGRLSSS